VATKTLNITTEAFELLKAHKAPGESFTDVIKRLAGDRSLAALVGVLSKGRADAVEKAIHDSRARSRARRSRQERSS